MTVITIREAEGHGRNAELHFEHGETFPLTIQDPFIPEEEQRLAWYFEEHLRFPFTNQDIAAQAAASIRSYGEALFNQVFADRRAYARYQTIIAAGLENLLIEIAGGPEFHRLHWEALWDPDLPAPLAVQAPLLRRNLQVQPVPAALRPSPTINLLLVTARPGEAADVGYRTIARPLVETVQNAGLRVQVDLVRPGSYRALQDHLEQAQDRHGSGYYHVVHFDTHGALLTWEQFKALIENKADPDAEKAPANNLIYNARYGRADLKEYTGVRAFLSLDGPVAGQPDLVEAGELAELLLQHQVPIVVLNACQSGMQVGDRETSLASRLVAAGVQMALAMSYSITVSAAQILIQKLYETLFAGGDLAQAACRGRLELRSRKGRRAYFNQSIDLEDWLLPVVYQNQAQRLQTRDFTPPESQAYYERQARRYTAPPTTYRFVGRDLDVLRIEKRLLERNNILLLRGMGGAGKTTLLHHLAAWWAATGFIEQAFYFAWDQKAWTRQMILDEIARSILPPGEFERSFLPLSEAAQQALLAERLRSRRFLLVLDNLESVTGSHLAVRNTLEPAERQALHSLLQSLRGGNTLALLGSRAGEAWLAPGTFEDEVYELHGLDPEAASDLADLVLARANALRRRQDPDLERLLRLLAGFPLAIQVALANLARQSPGEVLAALQAGDQAIDFQGEQKTESILRSIDYAFGGLEPGVQGLLACLAPFSGVYYTGLNDSYPKALRRQPALAGLPFERWTRVLLEAQDWGLLGPHPQAPGFLALQPTLPYFLRARLSAPEQAGFKAAVEAAYRQVYDGYAGEIFQLTQSKKAQEKQTGLAFASLEYENLLQAVELALAAQASIWEPYRALSVYLDAAQQHRRGLALAEKVLRVLEGYPPDLLRGPLGAELVGVIYDIAQRQLETQQYAEAERAYRKALALLQGLDIYEEKQKAFLSAGIYHQLGMAAQEQRRWEQAEDHYQKALEIKIESGNRYNQAKTYHQLGIVAQEQRRWDQAEAHYQKALEIKIESGDRHSQAATYHQLGMVAQAQRRWEQAEAHYQKALQIYIDFDDRYEQAGTYHQLGIVAQEQRRWEQAEAHYQKALEIYIDFGDRYEQAGTYGQLGLLAEEQGRVHQAQQHLLKCLEIFVEFNDLFSVELAMRNLGRLWRQSGDASLPAAAGQVLGLTPVQVEALWRKMEEGEEAG
jgi:tetratricopeptide (TPR) repeat protein